MWREGQPRLATSVWLLASGRDSELVGLLVAALLAEQKTAQSTDELLRFVRSRRAQLHDIRARNRAGSADRAGCRCQRWVAERVKPPRCSPLALILTRLLAC